MKEKEEPMRGWFWKPIELELTEDVTWDSGKRGVNWKSSDSKLVIVDGFWKMVKGYVWDGATGVPDGPNLPPEEKVPVKSSTGKVPITWIASLIHDIGYEYMDESGFPYTREEIDKFLYVLLKKCDFKYPRLYWRGVRIIGGAWHWIRGIFIKRIRYCFSRIYKR